METITQEEIINALKWRYATKVFDSSKLVSEDNLNTILESGRLAPSSLGIEPWKFIVVQNKELRIKMREASYNQPAITDASCIIVITRRTDNEKLSPEIISRIAHTRNIKEEDLSGFKNMIDGTISSKTDNNLVSSWITSQTYIPLGVMIETAALLQIDTCPMEGFDPVKIDEILGLTQKNLTSTTFLAVGYRGEDKYSTLPKVRRDSSDAIEIIK